MVVDVVGASGFGIETDDHPPQTLVVMRIRSRGNRQPLAFERDSSTSGMTGHSPKGEKREFEGYGEETLTERGKEEKREPWRPAQGGGGGGGQGVPNRASFAARPCPESPPQLAATTEQLPQPRAPCGKINQRLFSLPLWARFRPGYPGLAGPHQDHLGGRPAVLIQLRSTTTTTTGQSPPQSLLMPFASPC